MTQTLKVFGYSVILAAIFTILVSSGATAHAQQNPDPGQLLSPEQLDDLVAPIALYPDPLISQILVATTYPLEIVEASQWVQRNPNVRGAALTQAASNQDWDPSVQALVVFPDVLKYLTEDISWTTNLGNAFLAQEGDVMDAIQRMRDRAAQSGKLRTTPEQQVIRVVEAGQPVYEIVPTNPTVIYVPVYDPYWIWGVASYYPYPRWYYPPHAPYLYFNSGIYIDAYFGSGWYGSVSYGRPAYQVWNNWGWRPAWNTRSVVVNNTFIDNHYYNSSRPRYGTGTATVAWSHDASHRRGVVYPASATYDRYRRDPRDAPRPQQIQSQGRSLPAQTMTRNAGPSNAPRTVDRSYERSDGRSDYSQDSRPAARQDTRIASNGATSNAPRDTRSTSTLRNNPADSNPGSARIVTSPGQSQVQFTRQSTPAPARSTTQNGTRTQSTGRESQAGRSSGTSLTRTPSVATSRETVTARVGQQDSSARQSGSSRSVAPSIVQSSAPRQTSTGRVAAPAGNNAPAQQVRSSQSVRSYGGAPSNVQSSAPRQSVSSGGSASVGRSAPAQQSAPSSNAQGSGRSSSNGTNGGGNSRGRR